SCSLCNHSTLRPRHSFPTRRSSDLHRHALEDPVPAARDGRALVREQERDTVLLEVLERRHHRWGALRDDDREHLVLLDELACVRDRKSTRLNSSHEWISYAVFCLKK